MHKARLAPRSPFPTTQSQRSPCTPHRPILQSQRTSHPVPNAVSPATWRLLSSDYYPFPQPVNPAVWAAAQKPRLRTGSSAIFAALQRVIRWRNEKSGKDACWGSQSRGERSSLLPLINNMSRPVVWVPESRAPHGLFSAVSSRPYILQSVKLQRTSMRRKRREPTVEGEVVYRPSQRFCIAFVAVSPAAA